MAAVRDQKGFVSCDIGTPTRWNPDDYAMITKWEDAESLAAFAGENWNQAVIPPGMAKYAKQFSVVHYELHNMANKVPGDTARKLADPQH